MDELLDTKSKILDAAEELFAIQGFDTPSLRTITARAKVNLASVNYHFGSREALLKAVLERRAGPINAQRLRLLEESEARAGGVPPTVEEIFEAFLAPVFLLLLTDRSQAENVIRLIGRFHAESNDWANSILVEVFGTVARRFMGALHRSLPDLPVKELAWRTILSVGVMAQALLGRVRLEAFMPEAAGPIDPEQHMRRVISYVSAGMRAPLPTQPQPEASPVPPAATRTDEVGS